MGLKFEDVYLDMIIEVDTNYIGNRFKVLLISKDRVYTEYLTNHFPYTILSKDIGRFREYNPDLDFYREIIKIEN